MPKYAAYERCAVYDHHTTKKDFQATIVNIKNCAEKKK